MQEMCWLDFVHLVGWEYNNIIHYRKKVLVRCLTDLHIYSVIAVHGIFIFEIK